MAASHSRSADVARAVERQMRNWELAREQRSKAAADAKAAGQSPEVADFVTISRMVGSGGSLVAQALGEKLGWPVFDKEILQAMAGDSAWREQLYERLDERDVGWMEEILRWVLLGDPGSQGYVRQLTETILALARQGSAVFLGRGAEMILPQAAGLRVRIIAPPDACVKSVAEREGLSIDEAKQEFARIQAQRNEYMQHHFDVKPHGAPQHDIVINMHRYDVDAAVALIMQARERRRSTAST